MTHREKLEEIKQEVKKLEASIIALEEAKNSTGHSFSINYSKFIDKLNEITSK